METEAGRRDLLYFEQNAFDVANSLVLLDVDGTIVPDCGRTASPAVVGKVSELKRCGNEVRLCSNSRRGAYQERLAALAAQLDVGVCATTVRKPSPSVLSALERKGRAIVIIGDKDLTDGLLACLTRSRFIKVRRKVDPADRPVSRLTNFLDDTFGPIALTLWRSLDPLSRALARALRSGQATPD
jgi:predicted HAD superfamily phosphohydrolase YqeG